MKALLPLELVLNTALCKGPRSKKDLLKTSFDITINHVMAKRNLSDILLGNVGILTS